MASRLRVPGRLAFLAVLAMSGILAAGGLPLLELEQVRDWWTFASSATHLLAHQPLYFGPDGVLINLYPPTMAALWAVGLTSQVWLVLGIVSLAGVAALGRGVERPAFILLTLLQIPVLYDLLLGNVTSFYIGAIAICIAVPAWFGAVPLALVLGLAAKPAILPFLLVLLVRRRRQAVTIVAVAAAVNAVGLLLVGPAQYVEYLRALIDSQRQFAGWTTGNLGLARIGPIAVLLGLVVGSCTTIVAVRRLPTDLAFAVALGGSALVQATLGLYYGGFFIPGVILLWRRARLIAVGLALVIPLASMLVSPVAGGVLLLLGAFAASIESQRFRVRPARSVGRYTADPSVEQPVSPRPPA